MKTDCEEKVDAHRNHLWACRFSAPIEEAFGKARGGQGG